MVIRTFCFDTCIFRNNWACFRDSAGEFRTSLLIPWKSFDASKSGCEFKILFCQVCYGNPFTSSNSIIVSGEILRDSCALSAEVCKITVLKLIQEMLTFIPFPGRVIIIVSSMNLWGFYFMFLSKSLSQKRGQKSLMLFCARWEMVITPASLTSSAFQNVVAG